MKITFEITVSILFPAYKCMHLEYVHALYFPLTYSEVSFWGQSTGPSFSHIFHLKMNIIFAFKERINIVEGRL